MPITLPGYLIPKIGFRATVAIGSALSAFGYFMSIFAMKLWVLYITLGFLVSLGAGFLINVAHSAPLVACKETRTLVNSINASGGSVGMILGPILIEYLFQTYSLRGTFLITSGIALQGLVLAMLFPKYEDFFTSSEYHSIETNNKSKEDSNIIMCCKTYYLILKDVPYWMLIAGSISIDSLSNGCRAFLVDKGRNEGIPETEVVFYVSLWGITSAVSPFAAQIPFINQSANSRQISFGVNTLLWSLLTIFTINSKAGFALYCALGGALHGLSSNLWYLILADVMDKELVTPGLGMANAISGPYVLVVLPLAGWTYDMTRSYTLPYTIYGIIGIIGSVSVALIPVYNRTKKSQISTL